MTFGPRGPDITLDSLLVFDENVSSTRSDDVWVNAWMTSAPADATCADGTEGTRLTFRVTAGSGGNAAISTDFTLGSPIRSFQMEEVSLFTSGGQNFLGRRTMAVDGTWTSIEKIAGPLMASGVAFTYADTLNVATAVPSKIAIVGVTLRTQSADIIGAGSSNVRDSLITRVALRNNRRF
jgi:hypothetical protein